MTRRLLLLGAVALIGFAAAAPFLSADYFRGRIQNSLERALGRTVELGRVRFNVFTGPGFTVENVIIAEDPAIGVEPIARVDTLEARISFLSLFQRELTFASLRFVDPSVNLARTADGVWNLDVLLANARNWSDLPSLRVRNGRVNLKLNDTKSVLYFREVDMDLEPESERKLNIRFTGSPARTDRTSQTFGLVAVRGSWTAAGGEPGRLNLNVEVERSRINEAVRLIHGHQTGITGVFALQTTLSGPLDAIDIKGQLLAAELPRWTAMLPVQRPQLNLRGTLNLRAQTLELETPLRENPNVPVGLRFTAGGYLENPVWALSAELRNLPGSTLMDLSRRLGVPLAQELDLSGSLDGAVEYSSQRGWLGIVKVAGAELALGGAHPVRIPAAEIVIDSGLVTVRPAQFEIARKERVLLAVNYRPAAGALELNLETAGMSVEELQGGWGRLLDASTIPVLSECRGGRWSGAARYARGPGGDGVWTSDFRLRDAEFRIAGIADPVRVKNAAGKLNGRQVSLSNAEGAAGEIPFRAQYQLTPGASRAHRLQLSIAQADLAEMERLLKPSLARERGFLARTLGLGRSPIPAWLDQRQLDATVAVGVLTAAGHNASDLSTHLYWDGAQVRLTSLEGRINGASWSGEGSADLSGADPKYSFAGRLNALPFRGGEIDLEGRLEASGIGARVWSELRADGDFRARRVLFAPEPEFRSASGCFELNPASGTRWKLPLVEIQQGGEVFTGSGASLPDGRLSLDLANARRQWKLTAALAGPPAL
ncbi:MAG: AsmA family protein [Bryobacteraceae bacterium]|nr:AsmA family protein [Bryobacteraceae bacterium]